MEVRSPEDLYLLVEDLIIRLERDGETRLSAILDHRMHKVAWTSASELREELKRVLRNEMASVEKLKLQTGAVMRQVSEAIDGLLEAN